MQRTWFGGLVAVSLLALAPALRAGEKPAANEPTVVIRVNSLDTVLQNFKLLATLLGREQNAQDIQALIKAKVGAKGLQGIDLTRPLGAYVRFGEALQDLNGAVLIPVADQQAFLALLENLGLTPSKGKDGIYTLQTKQNIDLYLRFSKQYAYVSGINTENLSDKNLLDPAKVLAGSAESAITATVRLDQVPDAAKLLVLAQLEQEIQGQQEKDLPGETPAQKELRKTMLRQVSKTIADVLKEGQRFQVDIAVQKEKKDLALRVSLSGQPGTELAKAIATAGKNKSLFAGLMPQENAFRLLVDASLPPKMHEAFTKAMEDAAQKAIAEIGSDAKRLQAHALVNAVLPTVKAGHLDAFFGMAGPVDKHYTVLAAIKVVNGDELGGVLDRLLRSELKTLSAEQQQKIKLDVATVGSVKVHMFELPSDDVKGGKVLGGIPGDSRLYVAFRKDAVLMAIGPKALPALKEAIAFDQPAAAPLFVFDSNIARLAPLMAVTPEQRELAAKLFPPGKQGSIRITVDGGDAVTLRVNVSLDVLEYFAKMKKE